MSLLRPAFATSLLALSASAVGQTNSPVPPIAPAFAQGVPAQAVRGRSHGFFDTLRPAPASNAVPRPLSSSAAEVDHDVPKEPVYVCRMPVINVDASLDPRIVVPLSDGARRARIRVMKPECDVR